MLTISDRSLTDPNSLILDISLKWPKTKDWEFYIIIKFGQTHLLLVRRQISNALTKSQSVTVQIAKGRQEHTCGFNLKIHALTLSLLISLLMAIKPYSLPQNSAVPIIALWSSFGRIFLESPKSINFTAVLFLSCNRIFSGWKYRINLFVCLFVCLLG